MEYLAPMVINESSWFALCDALAGSYYKTDFHTVP